MNDIINGLSSDVLNEDSLREKCNGSENMDDNIKNGFQKNESSQDMNGKDVSFSIGSSGPNTTISEMKDTMSNGSESKQNPVSSHNQTRYVLVLKTSISYKKKKLLLVFKTI